MSPSPINLLLVSGGLEEGYAMLDGNRMVLLTESNYSEWSTQFKLLMEKVGALLLLLDEKCVEYVNMKTDVEGESPQNLLAMNNVQYTEWKTNERKWIFGFEFGQMIAKHPVEQAAYHRDLEPLRSAQTWGLARSTPAACSSRHCTGRSCAT